MSSIWNKRWWDMGKERIAKAIAYLIYLFDWQSFSNCSFNILQWRISADLHRFVWFCMVHVINLHPTCWSILINKICNGKFSFELGMMGSGSINYFRFAYFRKPLRILLPVFLVYLYGRKILNLKLFYPYFIAMLLFAFRRLYNVQLIDCNACDISPLFQQCNGKLGPNRINDKW